MNHEYRDSEVCKQAGITYHLAIDSEWEPAKGGDEYAPSAYEQDGFIHCTNGLDQLEWVANAFYKTDDQPRTVLVLKIDDLTSEVRYDDPDEKFPHIYGMMNTSAVIGELPVARAEDGTFTRLGS